jgi:tetratricopeptide (TPR) repeat protein
MNQPYLTPRSSFSLFGSLARVASLVAFASACSGSTPPAENPSNDPPPLDDPKSESGAESVAPSSAKVDEGMKAIEKQDFAGAKAILTQAHAENPKDPQAAFYLGVALQGLGELPAAKQAYQDALTADPKLAEASVNLSAILLDEKDAKGALPIIESALKSAPKHPDLLLNRALALEVTGDKQAAAKAYGEASAAKPDDIELRIAYAELLAATGNEKKAVEELKQVTNTDDPKLLAALSLRFGRLKAFSECIAVLDKAIKVAASPDLHVRRGVCRHDMGDDPGALTDYESAVKLDAKFAPAHLYMGKHYRTKGDKKKALDHLDQASKLDPTGGVGKAAKQAATELRSGKK